MASKCFRCYKVKWLISLIFLSIKHCSDGSLLLNKKTKINSRGEKVSGRGGHTTVREGQNTNKVQAAAGRSTTLSWSSEKNRMLNLTREQRRKVWKGVIDGQNYYLVFQEYSVPEFITKEELQMKAISKSNIGRKVSISEIIVIYLKKIIYICRLFFIRGTFVHLSLTAL